MKTRRGFGLFAGFFLLYLMTAYGGIRSHDGEIVFRCAESLAAGEGFSLTEDLDKWPGFGVASGADGKAYPVFGPLQSICMAPFVALASRAVNLVGSDSFGTWVPISYFVNRNAPGIYGMSIRPKDPRPHFRRFLMAWFNPVLSAFSVLLFFFILRKIKYGESTCVITSVLFGAGTLVWPYSGTFFSEPLALALVMWSFLGLLPPETGDDREKGSSLLPGLKSGVILGLAGTAHLSSVLFFPFWCFLALRREGKAAAGFLIGFLTIMSLLGTYDYVRFGNPFETGRTVDPDSVEKFLYGRFVKPWNGLYGLLFGAHKGLFFFCPIVLGGIAFFPEFLRRFPSIGWPVAGSVLLRLVFIAARSDWDGGYAHGPRYLLLILPFLLLPLAQGVDDLLNSGTYRRKAIWGMAAGLCISQQWYFCLGDVFYFLFSTLFFVNRGMIPAEAALDPTTSWTTTPLFDLLEARRAPFLLTFLPVSNDFLWWTGTMAFFLLIGLYGLQLRRDTVGQS